MKKLKKGCNKYEITDLLNIKSLNSSFNNLVNLVDNYDNYNNNEQKIYSLKYNKNNNIFFDFIIKRNLLNYDLNTIIKPIIINLDSRVDRLNHTIKECEKIGFYNYERFSAINFK